MNPLHRAPELSGVGCCEWFAVNGSAWHSRAGRGAVWHGSAGRGRTRQGQHPSSAVKHRRGTNLGKAWRCMAGLSVARQDRSSCGIAR